MPDGIIVVGAGIGGLTAALSLAKIGKQVVVIEAAERLEEIGAGIQLSPNASRVLIALGLRERLQDFVTSPPCIRVRNGRSGRPIVEIPLGLSAEARYGAPYWLIHRGDLQRVLLDACTADSGISLRLGTRYLGHTTRTDGVTAAIRVDGEDSEISAAALIGADGIWSEVRAGIGENAAPEFQARVAWRALIAPDALAPEFRGPETHLWLGPDAHLVYYPVQGGRRINIVAIARGADRGAAWDGVAVREDLLTAFRTWTAPVQAILRAADAWSAWSLHALPQLKRWTDGRVTLLGDAAHAMTPFIAQGGAMAIEDAAVLAHCVSEGAHTDIALALRAYEAIRDPRASAVARAAQRTGAIYHLRGPAALARNLAMSILGGERLRKRQDWLYAWRPPELPRPKRTT
jgi:salicylate hydroxylase